jgi:hypothetical protein
MTQDGEKDEKARLTDRHKNILELKGVREEGPGPQGAERELEEAGEVKAVLS